MTQPRERPTPEQASEAWERIAPEWIPFIRGSKSVYHKEVVLRAALNLLGDVEGKRVVDLGCGEGCLTRMLAGRGALCAGVDIAPTMICAAREQAEEDGLDIDYVVGCMTDPSHFEPESFDVVTSVMSVLEAPNGLCMFDAAAALLKPGGELVFVNIHPVFERGEWQFDDDGLRSICLITDYFGADFKLEAISNRMKGKVYQFAFSLSEQLNALSRAGFVIVEADEPQASAEAMAAHPPLRALAKTPHLWALRARKL